MKGELIPNKVLTVDDIEISPQILGDGAVPLRSLLMKRGGVYTKQKIFQLPFKPHGY